VIDDPLAARRLARAICADVQLYNGDKIRGVAPADGMPALAEPLREGLRLYVSRVSPELRPLFDEAAREMCERVGLPYHPISDEPSAPVRSEPMPMAAAHPPVPRREPAPANGVPPALVMLIAIACAIFGAAAFFFLSR
jgi:hypothetical protein